MKRWPLFVLLTIICWGAYVPTLRLGQAALGKHSALRAFLFIGIAYALTSALVYAYLTITKSEPMDFNSRGISLSTIAGILGAIGALGIVFAHMHGGEPTYVAPLVFAGAPIISTFVSMAMSRPAKVPSLWFYVGILLAACGAALVLRFRPT